MAHIIKVFADNSIIEFDEGKFDHWCVYLTRPNIKKYAPTDIEYFSKLKNLADKHGAKSIYKDFVNIYERTSSVIDSGVLNLIQEISLKYKKDNLEIAILFTIVYAGMVAEENKENAILKKRIKRLGLHQVLIDELNPVVAANFSKGKPWREIASVCKQKGF